MVGDGGGLVAKSCPAVATPWTVHARLLCHGISQAGILEWVAISFSIIFGYWVIFLPSISISLFSDVNICYTKKQSLKCWLILLEYERSLLWSPIFLNGFASSGFFCFFVFFFSGFFWTLSKANVKLIRAFPKICSLRGNLPCLDADNSSWLVCYTFLFQIPGKWAPLAREQGTTCRVWWSGFSRAWGVPWVAGDLASQNLADPPEGRIHTQSG